MRINDSGTLDTTFITTASGYFNTPVGGFTGTGGPGAYSIILSGSSILVVGNSFTNYKSVLVNRGAMIDSTGAISSSFNIGANEGVGTGFQNTVRTWAAQSDGKILAGGDFTTYSGSALNRIVRINTNGTRDTTFNVGTGFGSTVNNINVQSDGKIIVMGAFTTYSGSTSNRIARLNTDGTVDTTFNPGAGIPLGSIRHSVIQSDGKIIAVGDFTSYSGSALNRIVRINTNGTVDTTYNVGTGVSQLLETVILQSDGKALTGGNITSYSGSAINKHIRINTDGTLDTTFNPGAGTTGGPYAYALQSDGKIICTYNGSTYSGSTAAFISRINTDGTRDATFASPPAGLSTNNSTPNTLQVASDGKIYVGNAFTTYSGSIVNRIVRLNTNGTIDQTFNQSFPNLGNSTGKGANNTINAILLL
jgi:uncharacterized delta-60 repeat protein